METSKPANANDECVGPESEAAGKAAGCAGCPNQGLCASGELKKKNETEEANVKQTLSKIKRTVLVLSGKGGVGKSTTASQLAFSLARTGRKVGLLDLDVCGPSVPLMLGLKGREVHQSASGWSPVYVELDDEDDNESEGELAVMSIGFLMPDPDSAVIWRGPKKNALISSFLQNVDWGNLDYLVIDTPPGTSDEHITIVQLLKETFVTGSSQSGAVVVTSPQEVAMMDVRKELNFCKKTKIPVIGIVENMSTMSLGLDTLKFVSKSTGQDETAKALQLIREKCPELLELEAQLSVFPEPARGGPKTMAEAFGVPFLGKLPMDPLLQQAGEIGKPLKDSSKACAPLRSIVNKITASEPKDDDNKEMSNGSAANGSGVISA